MFQIDMNLADTIQPSTGREKSSYWGTWVPTQTGPTSNAFAPSVCGILLKKSVAIQFFPHSGVGIFLSKRFFFFFPVPTNPSLSLHFLSRLSLSFASLDLLPGAEWHILGIWRRNPGLGGSIKKQGQWDGRPGCTALVRLRRWWLNELIRSAMDTGPPCSSWALVVVSYAHSLRGMVLTYFAPVYQEGFLRTI